VNRRCLRAIAVLPVLMAAQPLPTMAQLLRIAPSSTARRGIVVDSIKSKTLTKRILATAIIEPNASAVAQVTSEIPARVVKLIAPLGKYVMPGEPLVILSSVELGQAKTEYLKTRSMESITRKHLAREESLYARKITPMKDLLEARAQHDTALAEYQAARERLRLLIPARQIEKLQWSGNGQPLSEFPLTTPIAGTLIKRDLSVGAMIDRGGPPPITVVNLDKVWVIANIFERDLADVKTGDLVKVTADAYPDNVFSGEIVYIGDEVDRATRSVKARMEVPNPEHLLKPGMFAKVSIAADHSREVVVAPESAIFEVNGQPVAFVPVGNDRFELRPLKLGNSGDGTVEIRSGLTPGDNVVAKGGLALKSLIANKAGD
jgi:membrane fusion protein, heavy metal efflux system